MERRKKKALVTGGASGIGRSAVLALARAGYDIALVHAASDGAARDTAAEARALGATVLPLHCDVRDEPAVRAALSATAEAFGHLDALVNHAGAPANRGARDLDSLDLDDWDHIFAVNVRGLFQVTRAAVPLLRRGTHPCVVNTAGCVAPRSGPQQLPFAASKAAVIDLTKTLARNLAPQIRVNAVAPGWVEGEWMQRLLGERYNEMMGQRAGLTPLRRCATAEDVAETMLSLIEANRFVTGEVLVVDGGFERAA